MNGTEYRSFCKLANSAGSVSDLMDKKIGNCREPVLPPELLLEMDNAYLKLKEAIRIYEEENAPLIAKLLQSIVPK
jgi:hypothetical protein